MDHDCKLFNVTFVDGNLKQTILIAAMDNNNAKSKAPTVLEDLAERGLIPSGSNWTLKGIEEIYVHVPMSNGFGLNVYNPKFAAVASGR
jgi:hypothetical protein